MKNQHVFYWDTSAIVSLFVQDDHSKKIGGFFGFKGINLLSSLTIAETFAVLTRANNPELAKIKAELISDISHGREWGLTHIIPANQSLLELSDLYRLRGADLWHLAVAVALKQDFQQITILTFDKELAEAANGEKIMTPENFTSG